MPLDGALPPMSAPVEATTPAEAVVPAQPDFPNILASMGYTSEDIEDAGLDPSGKTLRFMARLATTAFRAGRESVLAQQLQAERDDRQDILAAVVTGGSLAIGSVSAPPASAAEAEPEPAPEPAEPEKVDNRTEREKLLDNVLHGPAQLAVRTGGEPTVLSDAASRAFFDAVAKGRQADIGVPYADLYKHSSKRFGNERFEVVGFGTQSVGDQQYASVGEYTGDADHPHAGSAAMIIEYAVFDHESKQTHARLRLVAGYEHAAALRKEMGRGMDGPETQHPEIARQLLARYLKQQLEGHEPGSPQYQKVMAIMGVVQSILTRGFGGNISVVSNVSAFAPAGDDRIKANDESRAALHL